MNFAHWQHVHQKLVKTDTIRYSKNRIIDLIQKDLELSEILLHSLIDAARAIEKTKNYGISLDIRIVHFGGVNQEYKKLELAFSQDKSKGRNEL